MWTYDNRLQLHSGPVEVNYESSHPLGIGDLPFDWRRASRWKGTLCSEFCRCARHGRHGQLSFISGDIRFWRPNWRRVSACLGLSLWTWRSILHSRPGASCFGECGGRNRERAHDDERFRGSSGRGGLCITRGSVLALHAIHHPHPSRDEQLLAPCRRKCALRGTGEGELDVGAPRTLHATSIISMPRRLSAAAPRRKRPSSTRRAP